MNKVGGRERLVGRAASTLCNRLIICASHLDSYMLVCYAPTNVRMFFHRVEQIGKGRQCAEASGTLEERWHKVTSLANPADYNRAFSD